MILSPKKLNQYMEMQMMRSVLFIVKTISNYDDLMSYIGDNLYQFSQCDKAFTRKDYLKDHLTTHPGDDIQGSVTRLE